MKLFKNICLIIFIIITILFTLGYSALPLLAGTSQNNGISWSTIYYISYYSLITNDANKTTDNTKYNDLAFEGRLATINIVFKILLYSCITITCLLAAGIIIAFIGLNFVSKIIFLLALILMILVWIIILLIVIKNSIMQDITNYFSNDNINYDSGSILITISTILMFVNYLIYTFLA